MAAPGLLQSRGRSRIRAIERGEYSPISLAQQPKLIKSAGGNYLGDHSFALLPTLEAWRSARSMKGPHARADRAAPSSRLLLAFLSRLRRNSEHDLHDSGLILLSEIYIH